LIGNQRDSTTPPRVLVPAASITAASGRSRARSQRTAHEHLDDDHERDRERGEERYPPEGRPPSRAPSSGRRRPPRPAGVPSTR
jgi:hypothetical protein